MAGCGVVLAYICYSCSNIVVISIHIHAFKKAVCMHGSIVSPIMLPPIATTGREIGLHVLQTEHNV